MKKASKRFIAHADLDQWFEKAKTQIAAPTFSQLVTQFELQVRTQVREQLTRWKDAQAVLKSGVYVTREVRNEKRIERMQSTQQLQVLVPALRYVRALRNQVRQDEQAKNPLRLVLFLASKALGVPRLALQKPLTDKEVFETYLEGAQITAMHTNVARKLLREHATFFGLTSREISRLFDPACCVPTQSDLRFYERTQRRSAVLKKIKDAKLLTDEEFALIA